MNTKHSLGRIPTWLLALLVALSGLSLATQAQAANDQVDKDGKYSKDGRNGPNPAAVNDPTQVVGTALATVAGQDFEWCRTNTLARNDDSSTGAITTPFPLTFFGTAYPEFYVNNNGNITFNGSQSQYTPNDLTGATGRPIIAPFFADVDTTSEGSAEVTYGASPDGKAFCVNWMDVGYYDTRSDKLNSFQLILRSTQDQPGRTAGDFDMVFNYDQILWETGEASGGIDGLGGTSAAVGFSAGTGVEGTFIQFPGSFVNGALLDGGPNALISGSQGSAQQGRYLFEVHNEGLAGGFGSLAGTVERSNGDPVADAYVEVCTATGSSCSYTETDGAGAFHLAARPVGAQDLRVWPATDDLFAGGGSATVVAGQLTTMAPIVLESPQGMPGNVVLDGQTGDGTVPSIYYGDPQPLTVTGCSGVASPSYTVVLEGQVIRGPLPLTEGPAGTYQATIAPFYPDSGSAEIRTNVPATCGGALTEFNIYIDPSGTVTDQWGRPIPGASVTLQRSESFDGAFTVVPDGSSIMSPSNRTNPDVTNAVGYFRWDVTAGWYKVKVDAAGCDSATTPAMQVPPEKIDLVVKVNCPSAAAPTPTVAPRVSGAAKVGGTITAVGATWPGPMAESSLVLARDGVPLSGPRYTLTAGDVGKVFTAVSTGRRPDYVDASQNMTVTFASVVATSAGVKGVRTTSKTTMKAVDNEVTRAEMVKLVIKVRAAAGGSTAGKVKIKAGTKVVATKTVRAGGQQRFVIKVSASKLRVGVNKLQAHFSGNASTAGSRSTKITVQVMRS
ncbi:MAG: carboxypeptidase regulatory-like domain-containing protein [Nocardioides sp.]|nr:carboxypeptidase regulatory-like domain-containing protein [Nocardioides sp.]